MPDGNAMKDGVLLLASELHACSHFVHSPFDTAPISKMKTKNINEDIFNKLYQPPKYHNTFDYLDEAPERVYTSSGKEITGKTEFGCELIGERSLLMVIYFNVYQ